MPNIIQKPCKNYWQGRKGYVPKAFVIHIMQGTLAGTDAWFNNPASQVSAHFGVGKGGEIHQYVNVNDTAWHAGKVYNATWKGILLGINPNYYTIGIENEGRTPDLWTEAQIEANIFLIKQFNPGIQINRDTIVSHHEIASYKENMVAWCDEIIKRMTTSDVPAAVNWQGTLGLVNNPKVGGAKWAGSPQEWEKMLKEAGLPSNVNIIKLK